MRPVTLYLLRQDVPSRWPMLNRKGQSGIPAFHAGSINWLRLLYQHVLGTIAIRFGFNDKLSQFCDRCGRTGYIPFWTANDIWIAVAGNVNGHRHGAYCVPCFDVLARAKGICLDWTPTRHGAMSAADQLSKRRLRRQIGSSTKKRKNTGSGLMRA